MAPKSKAELPFEALNLVQLTVSSRRGPDGDTAGDLLCDSLQKAGHALAWRRIVPENLYQLRAVVSNCIVDSAVDGVLISGGTGLTAHDCAPEALLPLLDRRIPGFGELFRQHSFEEIASSSLQSRAFAGVANGTLIFALPGSPGACRTAWDRILQPQLDRRTRPCNFVSLVTRLNDG